MPLPEPTYNNVDTTSSPVKILRGTGGDSARMSPTCSPTPTSSSPSPTSPYFERLKSQDPEEDQGLFQKKSVLTKVKEKARKLRNSLSKKKMEDENLTPSWGVSLDDEEEEVEDAEYLGAPMYESELAPEAYKENARQHPRANPVISEKRILPTMVNYKVGQGLENQPAITTTYTTVPAHKMTAESVAEKLIPANAGGSKAGHYVTSKLQAVSSKMSPSQNSSVPSPKQNSAFPSAPLSEKRTSQKNPPLKDCREHKVESFDLDDTETESQTQELSEPTNARRTSNNVGVIEKVKGAVNSFLGNEDSSQHGVKTPATRSSSSQTQEVDQEENRGRILQPN